MFLCFCRWLVLAITMIRFYILKGTHKGLYRSIARTLKFFQTFALVEVKPFTLSLFFYSGNTVTVIKSASYCVFVLQVGHCAVGMWWLFFLHILYIITCPDVDLLFLFFWLCCRNCEDFCDCNWGSSVFANFHGLVHHQQHQTGEYDTTSASDYHTQKKKNYFSISFLMILEKNAQEIDL